MKPFHHRRFLNKPGHHRGAYVLAEVALESHYPSDASAPRFVSAYLTVADCARMATLDFDATTVAEARNAVHKVEVLQTALAEFRRALVEAIAETEPDLRRRRRSTR